MVFTCVHDLLYVGPRSNITDITGLFWRLTSECFLIFVGLGKYLMLNKNHITQKSRGK